MKTRMAALALLGGLLFLTPACSLRRSPVLPAPSHIASFTPAQAWRCRQSCWYREQAFQGRSGSIGGAGWLGPRTLDQRVARAVEEVEKLLGELDRAPRTVEVEVILAEIPAKKGDTKEVADIDLSGPRWR